MWKKKSIQCYYLETIDFLAYGKALIQQVL